MGRQYRGPRSVGHGGGIAGHYREFVTISPTTAFSGADGGAAPGAGLIPSYGVSNISTWGASTYVLAPPVEGCIKTFVSHSSAPAARVIKLSSNNSVTISYPGATTGSGGNTHISFAASTLDTCMTLMGLNSTHWVTVSVHPALNSTGTSITST